MNGSTRSTISAVIKTLNLVSVTGRDNLDMVLGCILALEKTLREEEPVSGILDDHGSADA